MSKTKSHCYFFCVIYKLTKQLIGDNVSKAQLIYDLSNTFAAVFLLQLTFLT